jgi:hypothetical protein
MSIRNRIETVAAAGFASLVRHLTAKTAGAPTLFAGKEKTLFGIHNLSNNILYTNLL